MSPLNRDLMFLVLQFLDEEKLKKTVHMLEQESGLFFDMKYLEEKTLEGEWDELDQYIAGFTRIDENRFSMKTFFEIRKQKYFEALDRNDRTKALEILMNELKVFSTYDDALYKELTHLLTLNNFRENDQLSKYRDTKTARSIVFVELKKLLESNPIFRDKLAFPSFKGSRLRSLINQSLNWQHQLCKNPRQHPDIKTLFVDHTCSPPTSGACAPTPATLPVPPVAARPPSFALGAHGGPFPPASTVANVNAFAGWMMNANTSSSIQSQPGLGASLMPGPPTLASILKHSRTPFNTLGMMDNQDNDHEPSRKRLRSSQSVDGVTHPAPLQHQHSPWSVDDLPRTVICTLHQGSTVTSMDFHPSLHSLLAVGCGNGEISLWEAGMRERLMSMPFKIKDSSTCSLFFQATIVKDPSISVSRVTWSPDGDFFGVAFTKHLVHLYVYRGTNDLQQNLEIDAHVGGVNDLAFSCRDKQLCIVTCGDDKLIKVWDLSGQKLFNFEGHGASVYSVCPHQKEDLQFIFSTSVDGKIKAWLYDNMGARVDYDAPGQWCSMLYSTDGNRLFSCGTSKDGESFLVEWNESEGKLKRTYSGFRKKPAGVVQFDTTKNRFLAAGEDNQIKFWDMDNINVVASTDAEGGLPSLPCLRFSKEGSLLAVTTADGGLKILANTDGMKLLRTFEARSYGASKAPVQTSKVSGSSMVANSNQQHIMKAEHADRSSPAGPLPIISGVDSMAQNIEKQRSLDDQAGKSRTLELTEIVDPVHCRAVTMPDSTDPIKKVGRLLYTNSGASLMALGAKGVQKLWKWSRSEQNPSGKATASAAPRHWLPNSGHRMNNDVPENSEEAVPCIAISKNDSYVMSSYGGKVSLFNMTNFKMMITFMPPPPSSTFLAFHPRDNNIIAIGMEDATIHFYNVKTDEVKIKLKGHQKRITGLAFSTHLNILVSSSADAELCFWSIDSWDKRKSLPIQLPAGKAPVGDTRVHFHSDQMHLLVCHESQLAIYDASKMELIWQWLPQNGLTASISFATYSCDSQLVYAAFTDGNIGVFDSDGLRLRCRIASSAYLHQTSSNSQNVYPLAVAAHPMEPNQFAVGLSDGSIKVIEPRESNGRWVPVDKE
ncbi:hypothetical protein RJT34_32280 [Clitoria ternatea]|uniref:CTLH domain-containing protein n=1 Tax=Clitoria ternatea TaxID=43366 RepID=A0AAN9I5R9_CLITE